MSPLIATPPESLTVIATVVKAWPSATITTGEVVIVDSVLSAAGMKFTAPVTWWSAPVSVAVKVTPLSTVVSVTVKTAWPEPSVTASVAVIVVWVELLARVIASPVTGAGAESTTVVIVEEKSA